MQKQENSFDIEIYCIGKYYMKKIIVGGITLPKVHNLFRTMIILLQRICKQCKYCAALGDRF